MNRPDFEYAIKHASAILDKERIDDVIMKSLRDPGGNTFAGYINLITANEEFAECQQEVSKFLRGKSDPVGLLEETADALISIRYIQKICGITDEMLSKAINVKIDRQERRNNDEL